jgi:DNA-binding NarL/FixJ family response regulator
VAPDAGAATVVLVDDQQEFLDWAQQRLVRVGRLAVVGQATNGEMALGLIASLEPSPTGVLLDVEMPGIDGFETARRMRSLAPQVRVILISSHDADAYARLATALGAAYLPKRKLTLDAVLDLLSV